jgi:hypothetical protein
VTPISTQPTSSTSAFRLSLLYVASGRGPDAQRQSTREFQAFLIFSVNTVESSSTCTLSLAITFIAVSP